MEGGSTVTLEDLYKQLQGLTDEHKANTAKLEERVKQLEADNTALRTKPDLSATASALSQTPKTKSALQEEEEQIKKGMAKMMANNAQWPIPSVATADAWAKFFKASFEGMATKGKTKPPEVAAVTNVLELQGELTDFLMAIAEGTFGNEDVRKMMANGLKSYITSYIGQKILQSEGELMKLVAKNDMPGTATMILGKVKDQIATARAPIQKRAASPTSPSAAANAAFAKGATVSALGLQKHVEEGHKAVDQMKQQAAAIKIQAAARAAQARGKTPEARQAAATAHAASAKGQVEKMAVKSPASLAKGEAAKQALVQMKADKLKTPEGQAAAAQKAAETSKAAAAKAQADIAATKAAAEAAKTAAASQLAAKKAEVAAAKTAVQTTKETKLVDRKTTRDINHQELKLTKETNKKNTEDAKHELKAADANLAQLTRQVKYGTPAEKAAVRTQVKDALNRRTKAADNLYRSKAELSRSRKALSSSRNANTTRRYIGNPLYKTKKGIQGTAKATGRAIKGTVKAVVNAPGRMVRALAPSNIKASLSNQLASYKAKMGKHVDTLKNMGSALNAQFKESAKMERLRMLNDQGTALLGKLKQQLTTAIEELERLREQPKTDLRDFNIEAKEKEVAQRKADYEKKESELLTQNENPVIPGTTSSI
jgi:hypothetical protein